MKLQSLSVIFIIIVLPITMVLSEYISNLIESREIEMLYDTKLLNSTYDAIKAYQLNTINNAFGDVTTQKVNDIEAAASTFFNSLSSNFNYAGYDSNVMQEYVSAIVFTMNDGYYIFSPYTNTLTELKENTEDDSSSYDESYSKGGEIKDGLKPYVYYNCRYVNPSKEFDFVITYTLDNYITIQGMINNIYVYDCGYLYSIDNDDGIKKSGENYIYNGITFTNSQSEEMKEYVGDTLYSYAKINGKKYYLDPNYYDRTETKTIEYEGNSITIPARTGIFYIDSTGAKNYNQTKGYSSSNLKAENDEFIRYYLAIKYNKSAYEYFKKAYEFSKMAIGGGGISGYADKTGNTALPTHGYRLNELSTSDAVIYGSTSNYDIYKNLSQDITNIQEYGEFNIFSGNDIGKSSSNFEQHRKAIIRYVIETNLTTSIASFSSSASTDFKMPKISEDDWEMIENDVCAISFMQGMSIGSKQYNGYAAVSNTLGAEHIDESDIYILATDLNGNKIYCKPNDKKLEKTDGYSVIPYSQLGYYSGILKLNFEQKQDASNNDVDTIIYQPMSYTATGNIRTPYLGSYTSIMGTSDVELIGGGNEYADMHSYLKNSPINLKTAYYNGFARERWGSYNVNNINYELNGNSNGCDYFLNDYQFVQ